MDEEHHGHGHEQERNLSHTVAHGFRELVDLKRQELELRKQEFAATQAQFATKLDLAHTEQKILNAIENSGVSQEDLDTLRALSARTSYLTRKLERLVVAP